MQSNSQSIYQPVTEFKSRSVNMACIRLYSCDTKRIELNIQEQIRKSPTMFKNAPIILDLENVDGAMSAKILKEICVNNYVYPVAVQNCTPEQKTDFLNNGIPAINNDFKPIKKVGGEKIITTSVRTGQQLYYECPVTILGDVKAGAEIISHNSIHIYGTLYGKAIAGIQGNLEAQIFMKACKAELISIGKRFVVPQEQDQLHYDHNIRIRLFNDELKILRF